MSGPSIALSNLAWPAEALEPALALLASGGAAGVEVAPTRIAPWEALQPTMLEGYRAVLNGHGLAVSSLQAIFFGVPEAQLLADEAAFQAMAAHLRRIGMVGRSLGASVCVFGAPRNRNRGALPLPAALDLAATRLRALASIAVEEGLVLAMEPVPAAYNSDVLTTWEEVLELVETVDHSALRLHLDTACVALGGGDIAAAVQAGAARLAHMHAAQPQLIGFEEPLSEHAKAGAALAKAGYRGWVAVEMLQQPDWAAALALALATARRCYVATPV